MARFPSQSPEYRREYNRQYYLRKKNDPEFMERSRERCRKSRLKPEVKAHQKAYNKERLNDPEYRERHRQTSRNWHSRPENKARNELRRIEREYGITVEIISKLRKIQGGKCPGCKMFLGKHPHIDHDHRTGKVRALLCRKCNLALGFAGDRLDVLLALVEVIRNPPADKLR